MDTRSRSAAAVAVCAMALASGIAAIAPAASAASAAPAAKTAKTAQAQPPPAVRLTAGAVTEMQALAAEKRSRTAAQRKMDSQLLYALHRQRGDSALAALPHLRVPLPDADGTVLVDVKPVAAAAIPPLLLRLRALGGRIESVNRRFPVIRARLSLATVETVAARPEVRFVRRARRAVFSRVDSEGDATHLAAAARAHFGVDGSGKKVCVLSDGIDSLATLQAAGDLPAVDVLAGQAGAGDEGTALLELVHDLAPGAALGFATANPDEATLAQNILDLRSISHCDILLDDVEYLGEAAFQDSVAAQAVDQVTAAGALYFSSAGNEGSLDAGTSGTWEGDFHANGDLAVLGAGAGAAHDFGDGGQSDPLTAATPYGVLLQWADPAGASCNDYDLYVLDSTLSTVVAASTDTQDCTEDPLEQVGSTAAGERVVVTLFAGAGRLLDVQAFRGQLQLATSGCIRGHNSAAPAFGIAAAPAAGAAGPGEPSGPYPGPFTAAQLTEIYSCDGPRRVFFDFAGNLLPGAPAGDFSSSGGVLRQKPDLTAADGVSTDVEVLARFYGTSASAAHAAAIAALLESSAPALTPGQIRAILTGSAIDLLTPGWDRDSGAGIAMAYAALTQAGVQPGPLLALGAVTPTEVTPGGDSAIDPGEDWSLRVELANTAGVTARTVTAALAIATPGVALTNAVSAYPDIAVGGTAANSTPFLFTPYALACGTPIQLTLTVTATGLAAPAVFSFSLPTGHAGPQCPQAPALSANLTATKAVTGGTLLVGGSVIYTLTLVNSGNGASFDDPGDELVDTLPPTLTLLSAAATLGTVTTSGNTVHWNGGVPAGGSVSLTIEAAIGSNVAAATLISNQAMVAYDPARAGANTASFATAAPGVGGPTQFLAGAIASVPALSAAGLALLALALAACGMRFFRRRAALPGESGE
jgi:hypothetical protein